MFKCSILDTLDDIPDKISDVILKDVDEANVHRLKYLPKHVTQLQLIGKLTHLEIPEGIHEIICCSMGLQTISVHDDVKYLYCSENCLSFLEIPKDMIVLYAPKNKLSKLKCKNDEELTQLVALDISHNLFTDFDLKLPQTMFDFNISGNPEHMRIKYLNFVIDEDDRLNCFGDYLDILGDGLLFDEYARVILGQRCFLGRTYINLKTMI